MPLSDLNSIFCNAVISLVKWKIILPTASIDFMGEYV